MFDIRAIQEQILLEAVQTSSDAITAREIVYGVDESAKNEDNAAWVKAAMGRLEDKFDREQIKCIRMGCQCGYGMDETLALIKELMSTTTSLEEFANSDKAQAAGLFCTDGVLYLQFLSCPCPMLADVDRLETTAWCQCTTGYSKALFEQSLGCEVSVELLKRIKMGDEICLMTIIPVDSIWK